MTAKFDHVAIQVASLDSAVRHFRSFGCTVGVAEEFVEEGTRETYVGADGCAGRLLLIEPIGAGPYERSLARRGPGLHHVAVGVQNVETFVSSLAGTGWLLHVGSLASVREFHTAWLARPGVPVLVEVFRSADTGLGPASEFITAVEIPVAEELNDIFDSLGVGAIRSSSDGQTWLTFDGRRDRCSRLCSS